MLISLDKDLGKEQREKENMQGEEDLKRKRKKKKKKAFICSNN